MSGAPYEVNCPQFNCFAYTINCKTTFFKHLKFHGHTKEWSIFRQQSKLYQIRAKTETVKWINSIKDLKQIFETEIYLYIRILMVGQCETGKITRTTWSGETKSIDSKRTKLVWARIKGNLPKQRRLYLMWSDWTCTWVVVIGQ